MKLDRVRPEVMRCDALKDVQHLSVSDAVKHLFALFFGKQDSIVFHFGQVMRHHGNLTFHADLRAQAAYV